MKAKQEPTRRFHFLYDKVWREDILAHAFALSRANGGAPGVDGETFARIEVYGVERWLGELREEIRTERYKPQPVRRVMIPKASGVGQRPLGIPTIRDRVVETAATLVLEPIFEADFDEAAYGYRPKRGALDAVRRVHLAIDEGHTEVVDADLSKYFDTIPHSALLRCVARRISDGKMLHLIQALQALRGVQFLVALTVVAELGDLTRFDSPRQLAAFVGLIPSEHSSGPARRQGGITKAGNGRARRALIEAAWAYRHPAKVSQHIQTRIDTLPKPIQDIGWKAQVRLCKRFRRLTARGKHPNVAVTAIARELIAFMWAIAKEVAVTA